MRVLVVGGGSGGASGFYGGGGSGNVSSGEYDLTAGELVNVTVGVGGNGSTHKIASNSQDGKAGGASSFGSYLSAAGGQAIVGSYKGADGGSGGGGGCIVVTERAVQGALMDQMVLQQVASAKVLVKDREHLVCTFSLLNAIVSLQALAVEADPLVYRMGLEEVAAGECC